MSIKNPAIMDSVCSFIQLEVKTLCRVIDVITLKLIRNCPSPVILSMKDCTFILKVCLVLLLFLRESQEAQEHETRLIDDLLKDYESDARPVKNASDAITVTVNLLYNQLQNLDEPTQVMRSLVWITMYWRDEFLKWDAKGYGGTSKIRLEPSRIWKPDITLYNNAHHDGDNIYNAHFKTVVNSNGSVEWYTYEIMHSVCHIDVSKFPFDTQICKMKIGSWTHDVSDLDLKLFDESGEIDLYQYDKNAVWELKSARAQRNAAIYKCCSAPYIDITYTLEFRRKPLYYTMTIVLPSMLLSLLSSISFLFPADSGERVSLVISVLLGLVVFMLIVNERTPVNSDSVPMCIQFFTSIGASTVLALMATAFILRLNHVSSNEPVPRYLTRIRDRIVRTLRINIKNKDHINPETKPARMNSDEPQRHSEVSGKEPDISKPAAQTPTQGNTFAENNILKELQKFSKHLEEENLANEMKEDWRYTMKVFDRFFFVIFMLIFFAFAADVLFVYVTM